MTDQDENISGPEPHEGAAAPEQEERFPELAELEEKIQRRLRSNKRFLERFMDEDFDELDDEDTDVIIDDDEPDQFEEL